MQQALHNSSINSTRNTNSKATKAMKPVAPRPSGLLRWAAARWEMACVLALMGSSAAYGASALAHLGL